MKHDEDRDEKAFCVLESAKTESIVMVQRRFRTKYNIRVEPPMDKAIHEWYKKFQQIVSLCAVKQTGSVFFETEVLPKFL
jgi:hypothetical protein